MIRPEIRPLHWNQGLFLTPQHFQLLEGRQDTLRQHFHHLAGPHGWGIRRLTLNIQALAHGEVDIVACEALFRGGTYLRVGPDGPTNATLKPRKCQQLARSVTRPVQLFLAVPVLAGSGANVDGPGRTGEPRRRFDAVREGRRDQLDPQGTEVEVGFLSLNPEIVLDTDPGFQALADGHDLLKLGELNPQEGGFNLSAEQIAPCLSLDAVPALHEQVDQLRHVIYHRALEFAELKRERVLRGTASTPQDVYRTIILHILNRQAGTLRGLAEAPWTHPAAAYQTLMTMMAELSSFSDEYNLDGAPEKGEGYGLQAYDHERIGLCFREAGARIRAIVKRLSIGSESSIALKFNGEFFTADIPDWFFKGKENQYYLMIESNFPGDKLEQELMHTGKLTSRAEMAKVLKLALFGLRIEYQRIAPPDLPMRSIRHAYFRIDTTSPHWELVREQKNLALFFTSLRPDETNVKLVRTTAD